ncbi:MAG TPA: ATP-binding protein [Methanoregulaceae archaeon]|nr:ATP-binding protein [Methanoregulaceae archaeon]
MRTCHALIVDAERANLLKIAEFLEEHLLSHSVGEKDIFEIGLAVDEACSNIILHGYREKEGRIEVELQVNPDLVTITIKDEGRPFNPLTVEPPVLSDDIEQRVIGGLGVYLIKKTMDEVSYVYRDGMNKLVLAKKRTEKFCD